MLSTKLHFLEQSLPKRKSSVGTNEKLFSKELTFLLYFIFLRQLERHKFWQEGKKKVWLSQRDKDLSYKKICLNCYKLQMLVGWTLQTIRKFIAFYSPTSFQLMSTTIACYSSKFCNGEPSPPDGCTGPRWKAKLFWFRQKKNLFKTKRDYFHPGPVETPCGWSLPIG